MLFDSSKNGDYDFSDKYLPLNSQDDKQTEILTIRLLGKNPDTSEIFKSSSEAIRFLEKEKKAEGLLEKSSQTVAWWNDDNKSMADADTNHRVLEILINRNADDYKEYNMFYIRPGEKEGSMLVTNYQKLFSIDGFEEEYEQFMQGSYADMMNSIVLEGPKSISTTNNN